MGTSVVTPEHLARAGRASREARASRMRVKKLERPAKPPKPQRAPKPPRPTKPRAGHPHPRKGMPLTSTRPFASAETALWSAVIERVVMDIQLGLAALRDDVRSYKGVDAAHYGAAAARWWLRCARHRDLLLIMIDVDPTWFIPAAERSFGGRERLEELAAWVPKLLPVGRRRRAA
jgi:hypothetical protein